MTKLNLNELTLWSYFCYYNYSMEASSLPSNETITMHHFMESFNKLQICEKLIFPWKKSKLTCASRSSVCAMRSSRRSPRSITFSIFCVMTSLTSFTCDCNCPNWSLSGAENFSCKKPRLIKTHSVHDIQLYQTKRNCPCCRLFLFLI